MGLRSHLAGMWESGQARRTRMDKGSLTMRFEGAARVGPASPDRDCV